MIVKIYWDSIGWDQNFLNEKVSSKTETKILIKFNIDY